MRETPTWRIPFGIIGLFVALIIYGVIIARYAPGLIGRWPGLSGVSLQLDGNDPQPLKIRVDAVR